MSAPSIFYKTAANGDSTVLDLGAGTKNDKLNWELVSDSRVTAATVTIQGSTDNFSTSTVTIAQLNNVLRGTGFVQLDAPYRYLRVDVANYAGSGSVAVQVEVSKVTNQN